MESLLQFLYTRTGRECQQGLEMSFALRSSAQSGYQGIVLRISTPDAIAKNRKSFDNKG
jgi:hypothetical protein